MNDNQHGALPHTWAMTTVHQVADSIEYGLSESANLAPVGPKFLRITDLQDGTVNWSSVPYCRCPSKDIERYKLRANDIVFARTGATTGKSYLIRECPQTVFASYLIRLRIRSIIEPTYFAWFLQSPNYWSQIIVERKGSAQPGVNASILSTLKLPLAPLAEQSRIVAEIEKQLSRLDAGVAALKRVQANLKRYRAAVLRAGCEGRLVPTEAELARQEGRAYEPADALLQRILCERRARWEAEQLAKLEAQGRLPLNDTWKAKYPEPAAPDTSSLPELPEGWRLASVEMVAAAIDPQPSHRTPPIKNNGIAYIGMGDVDRLGIIDKNNARKVHEAVLHEHRGRYSLRSGDFFIGKIGTIGKPVKLQQPFDYVLSANVVLLQPYSDLILSQYAFMFMGSSLAENQFASGSRATTQSAFGIQKVRQLSLPLPPFAEQERIVAEVERRLSIVEEVEATVAANLKRAERLRRAVLGQAFAGRLVPQDPNDEPASTLLARIRAERAETGKPAREKMNPARRSSRQTSMDMVE